jgi:nicotinamidase/pyrazinamidase
MTVKGRARMAERSKMSHDRSEPAERSALLVVDVQRDFCPGGALPARDAQGILPALNRHLTVAQEAGMPVYASRDWHPPVTSHFRQYGGEWPPHCVRDTEGARFHPDLRLPPAAIVVSKGEDPARPGYSSFDGRTSAGATLLEDLRSRGIQQIYVAGLTTEYCVKQTVMDARRAGLRVTVLLDAVAGIDAEPGDAARAIAEMVSAGAAMSSVIAVLPSSTRDR